MQHGSGAGGGSCWRGGRVEEGGSVPKQLGRVEVGLDDNVA